MKDSISGEKDPLLDPLIRSYFQANLDLVRTIGIKSERTALEQNRSLTDKYGDEIVDSYEPSTWKYYLNLSGEYHPTDTPMMVTSLDTLVPIPFTRSSLANHRNTLLKYQYGTRYYRTLVTQYPEQEDLIMGILMPCDIQKAIEAEDGDILRYNKDLVEENEYSLMKDLETSIKHHIARWYVDSYSITDEYYLMAYYSSLYLSMLPKLLNLRDSRRNTYEANSFHVRMFLRGYLNLDKYYPFLTQKQAMYLYRNLPRLIKSIGYDIQFKELMDNILSPRKIQMLGYNIRQTTQIGDGHIPEVVINSEALNDISTIPILETITPHELFLKEQGILYGTREYYEANEERIFSDVQHQNHYKALTKDVVASNQEGVSIFSLKFSDIALSHWGYMVANKFYDSTVIFDNPRTISQQILTSKNAFIYFYYLSLSYISEGLAKDLTSALTPAELKEIEKLQEILKNRKVTRVPEFMSFRHITSQSLSLSDLLSYVDTKYRPTLTEFAKYLLLTRTKLNIVTTPQNFYNLCVTIFSNYISQHGNVNGFTDPVTRGYARNMVYRLYEDTLINLVDSETNIETFLTSNNLDSYEVAGNYIPELIRNLYNSGTGSDINNVADRKNIITAMISIMKLLTSYNIQYIEHNSENDLTYVQTEPCCINGYINQGITDPNDLIRNIAFLPIGISVQDVVVTPLT